MGNIVIVEDNTVMAKGFAKIIKQIDSSQNIKITGYAGKAFDYSTVNDVSLFVIDIQLLDYSGLELAKQIRNTEKYKMTPIVFITSAANEMVTAFKEIHCYDYIVKPFNVEEVENTLKTIIHHGSGKQNQSDAKINIKQKGHYINIKLDEIVYIESRQRKLQIVTINEVMTISSYTLTQLKEQLPETFLQCHKGFIVNNNYIRCVDKINRQIDLSNEFGSIPLGLTYKEDLLVYCV